MAALSEKQGLLSPTFGEQGGWLCYFTEQSHYFHMMLQKRRISADLCPASTVQHLISADKLYVLWDKLWFDIAQNSAKILTAEYGSKCLKTSDVQIIAT